MVAPNTPHQIEILIDPNGNIVSTVKGVSGPSCAGLDAWIAELGAKTGEENTEDFYKPDEQGITYSTGY